MHAIFFTRVYSPYKPYMDAQFADLISRGWDLKIFTAEPPTTLSQRAQHFDIRSRVRVYPQTLRAIPAQLPYLARRTLRSPSQAIKAFQCAGRSGTSIRGTIRTIAQAIAVGGSDPDFCFVHELETATGLRWLKDRFPQATMAMHYHGGEIPTIPQIPDELAAATFDSFDLIFTNTEFAADQVVERGGDRSKIIIMPVGFAMDDYPPPRRTGYRQDGTLRLLAAGRVSVEKGFADAIEAVRMLLSKGKQRVHLEIVGDGPLLPDLKEAVARERLESHVTFAGRIQHEQLIEKMGTCDVLLLPSRPVGNWAEIQGSVMQDAMLMRTPVIAARTGGVLESIPPFLHPFSVESGDAASLTSAIDRIAALEVAQVEQLGTQCEAWTRQRYDIEVLNDRMLSALGTHSTLEAS